MLRGKGIYRFMQYLAYMLRGLFLRCLSPVFNGVKHTGRDQANNNHQKGRKLRPIGNASMKQMTLFVSGTDWGGGAEGQKQQTFAASSPIPPLMEFCHWHPYWPLPHDQTRSLGMLGLC